MAAGHGQICKSRQLLQRPRRCLHQQLSGHYVSGKFQIVRHGQCRCQRVELLRCARTQSAQRLWLSAIPRSGTFFHHCKLTSFSSCRVKASSQGRRQFSLPQSSSICSHHSREAFFSSATQRFSAARRAAAVHPCCWRGLVLRPALALQARQTIGFRARRRILLNPRAPQMADWLR